ncbi:hypothetical protein CLONEX_01310 [[Clostridium] nexile DSM 1787]|nr:hypothetical protein CLONEX_01310 [[Clostridium] nexile DSM 1787]
MIQNILIDIISYHFHNRGNVGTKTDIPRFRTYGKNSKNTISYRHKENCSLTIE